MTPIRSTRSHRSHARNGIAIVFTALMLVIVIPLVGLAIDAGTLYAIRAKLQSAADAAALAAGRSLSAGQTVAAQQAAAQARGEIFFKANFPDGTLETVRDVLNVQVTLDNANYRRVVEVTARYTAPAFFMRFLGWGAPGKGLSIAVGSKAVRRDVNLMLVLDRSGSLEDAGACDDVENAAIEFTRIFANGRDRVGLITYGSSYRVDYAPVKFFKDSPALVTEIDKIAPGGCLGGTNTAQALWNGYAQVANIAEPGALNAVVLFTDGQPNQITAEYSVDTHGANVSRCYDYLNARSHSQAGWSPVNQRYFGSLGVSVGGNPIGLFEPIATQIPITAETVIRTPIGYSPSVAQPASNDCRFRENTVDVPTDIPFIPDTDYYGNRTDLNYKPVLTVTDGGPYHNRIRTDDGETVRNAAINAVVSAGQRAHVGTINGIAPIIYTIGLGGAGAAEHELLRRVANDRNSAAYDSSKPQGVYIFAPTPADLNDAFARIGAELLRFDQ